VPSDLVFKGANLVHRTLLRVSGGRLGSRFGSMPVLELTTTGRKSGQPRTVILTSPVQLGDAYVVVASRGGDPRHPDWYVNLEANPSVQVKVGGGATRAMRARIVDPEERARLWPQVTTAFKGYAGYQTKTTREIPLVVLEPAPS
jgi:deazaflavin-dependent oxidoreductase (nitroreductase family)